MCLPLVDDPTHHYKDDVTHVQNYEHCTHTHIHTQRRQCACLVLRTTIIQMAVLPPFAFRILNNKKLPGGNNIIDSANIEKGSE